MPGRALALVDVEREAAELPALQRVAGGVRVHQAAARHVDRIAPGFIRDRLRTLGRLAQSQALARSGARQGRTSAAASLPEGPLVADSLCLPRVPAGAATPRSLACGRHAVPCRTTTIHAHQRRPHDITRATGMHSVPM